MAGRLKGKIAVVTAAGAGIGRAIAEAFVAEGATGLRHRRETWRCWRALPRPRSASSMCSPPRRSIAFAAKVGPIDILVNAAGFVHHGTILECDDKAWDFSFDLNVKSMHRTIKAFLPGMLSRGKGSLVNIASGAGSVRGIPKPLCLWCLQGCRHRPDQGPGCRLISRKACGRTRSAPARSSRRHLTAASRRWRKPPVSRCRKPARCSLTAQPMGRLGTAEEIAMLAVYLASDESSYTTGQIHLADGGFAL